jgi:hypothetical protein
MSFLLVATQPMGHEHQPWQAPAQASPIYWVLVVLVGAGIVAFMLWALYGRLRPRRWTTAGYHALGALVIIMTLFTLVLYIILSPPTKPSRFPQQPAPGTGSPERQSLTPEAPV